MSKYFFIDGNDKYGPFSLEELKEQKLSRKTKVWRYGMEKWTMLSEVPELTVVLNSIPPELPSKPANEERFDETESIIKVKAKKDSGSGSQKIKKKPLAIRKWIIAIISVIVVLLFAYLATHNQSDLKLYNEIVASSYDSNEDFEMYVEKFYRDVEFYGIYPKKPKIKIIKFAKLDQIDHTTHIHGLSFGSDDDDRIEIYINPSTWRQFSKAMRYILIYHELSHDVLNVDDLEAKIWNEGKLMYPEISNYENKNMDDFIESAHALFEEQSAK